MHEYNQPPELDGEPEDSRMLPPLDAATDRVIAFLKNFGDGCVDVVSFRDQDFPLYARDLEVLTKHAGKFKREFGHPDPTSDRRRVRYVTEWKPA